MRDGLTRVSMQPIIRLYLLASGVIPAKGGIHYAAA